ncbi:MAG: AMP-binding protein [Bdellovibrionia bacterium]
MKASFLSPDQSAEFLALLEDFLTQLYPARDLTPLQLSHRIEEDLGIDSLARAQLGLQIQRRWEISLPSAHLFQSQTLGDLFSALLSEQHKKPWGWSSPQSGMGARILETPLSAQTLIDVLSWHAKRNPQQVYLEMIHPRNDPPERSFRVKYIQLLERSQRVAAELLRLGLSRGEPVAIALPTGEDFFFSFFGVLLAGGVAVPLYPPRGLHLIEEELKRHVWILSNCQARLIITLSEGVKFTRMVQAQLSYSCRILSPTQLSRSAQLLNPPSVRESELALIQYTSGSTGNPKGVTLTHAQILANIRAMGSAISATCQDVFVSWLPLYHDMGLIGAALGSFYYGALLVLTSPLEFLAYPPLWLQLIHRYRGTLSAAPNFAYDLVARETPESVRKHLDLSLWRVAFNGSEPVSANTLRQFTERFQSQGFHSESLVPVYGLAECSVGLTFSVLGRKPRVDRILREDFQRLARAGVAPSFEKAPLEVVSCGFPLPAHQVRIVNEDGLVLSERRVGRIQFQGPSSTLGYYRNPQANRELFEQSNQVGKKNTWLNTGDLGYLAQGELFVTGRSKDLIIRGGQHFFPEMLEQELGRVPGVRRGCVAVLGQREVGGVAERVLVLVETRIREKKQQQLLHDFLVKKSQEVLKIPIDQLLLLPPRSLLKTPSGKIRRSACLKLYESGQLGRITPLWRQRLKLGLQAMVLRLMRTVNRGGQFLFSLYFWLVAFLLLPFLGVTLVLPGLVLRQHVLQGILRLLWGLTRIRIEIQGSVNPIEKKRIPSRAKIFVSNHTSYLDALVLATLLHPPFSFVAKNEFLSEPLLGWTFRRLGCVFVERWDAQVSVEDFERIKKTVLHSADLVFFPEGTFSAKAELGEFRMGAFQMAAQSGHDLVPIVLLGAREVFYPEGWQVKRGRIRVWVLPSVRSLDSSWQSALLLRESTRELIRNLIQEEQDRNHKTDVIE